MYILITMRYMPLIFCLFTLPAMTGDNDEIRINLEKVIVDKDGTLSGMSNIFFQPANDDFIYPSEWNNVEIAVLSEGEGFKSVHVLRHEFRDGEHEYIVDTTSDSDFTKEKRLVFGQFDGRFIADVQVYLHTKDSDIDNHSVNYQVIKIEDWTYGRISEYRKGNISIEQEVFDIMVRPRNRGEPLYGISPNIDFYIDYDQNGEFVERWQVSEDGNLLASEAVDITQPFIVNNQTYQVTEIDPLGSYMMIKQVDNKEGVAEGLIVSNITIADRNGNLQELHSFIDLDKPVLLEFWSTSCPFSERVRPDLNELYELYGEDFTLLSSPRETNKQLIDDHLGEHPKNGILLTHDESVWQQFNPLPVSPLFYLIDNDGTIKMKAAGANSIEPLKIKLSQVITNSK